MDQGLCGDHRNLGNLSGLLTNRGCDENMSAAYEVGGLSLHVQMNEETSGTAGYLAWMIVSSYDIVRATFDVVHSSSKRTLYVS